MPGAVKPAFNRRMYIAFFELRPARALFGENPALFVIPGFIELTIAAA